MALKRRKGEKVVIILHYAMSGCTFIALAADEIIMDQDVALGPLDLQIQVGGAVCPAPSIIKVAEVKGDNA
jgi:ClpP class serine protease